MPVAKTLCVITGFEVSGRELILNISENPVYGNAGTHCSLLRISTLLLTYFSVGTRRWEGQGTTRK